MDSDPHKPQPGQSRRIRLAWALYDMGNSAFYLVVVAAVFKLFYQDMVVAAGGQDGDPRRGMLAMVRFFAAGAVLLWRVDVDAGRRTATLR